MVLVGFFLYFWHLHFLCNRTFQSIGNGQPNGGEDEICVQKRNAHYGLQWNDVDCSNLAYFLCAYDHNLYRPELEGKNIS